jgi:hypothetical protein
MAHTSRKGEIQRSRFDQTPRFNVSITQRDLRFLHSIFIHGPLSSWMLRALHAPNVVQDYITDRLRKLNLNATPLLFEPPQQKLFYNAKFTPLTFNITEAGIHLLLLHNMITSQEAKWYKDIVLRHNDWHHDRMAAYLTASIELGAKQAGVEFIPWTRIIANAPAAQAANNPFAIPLPDEYDDKGKPLYAIPDGLFGLRPPTQGFSFYTSEFDNNTEANNPKNTKRASIVKKIRDYRHIIFNSIYKTHFNIPNMRMLVATTAERRLDNFKGHLQREIRERPNGCGPRPFLWKSMPELDKWINKPKISGQAYSEPWQCVGAGPVQI